MPMKLRKKVLHVNHGPIVYNRARLMKKQLLGVMYELTEKDLTGKDPEEQKKEPSSQLPPINAYLSENHIILQTQTKKPVNNNNNNNNAILLFNNNNNNNNNNNININNNNNNNNLEEKEQITSDEEKELIYEPKEEIKIIRIRFKFHWLVMKFENCIQFYEFLDEFKLFGLVEENGNGLIINHYDDLKYNSDNNNNNNNLTHYRIVLFNDFDSWLPLYIEEKNNNNFKKMYDDTKSVAKQGVVSKVEKTIGIRNSYIWLQLTFRWAWEFHKFLHDSGRYGFIDEKNFKVVRNFSDLQSIDYRLLSVVAWDNFKDLSEDPDLPKSMRNTK